MKTRRAALVTGCIATALLAGCGGGSSESGSSADTLAAPNFRAYALAHQALQPSSAASAAAGTPAQQQEIARISRDWAVDALAGDGSSVSGNQLAVPALHFALAYAVQDAAAGDTLAGLQQVLPAVSGSAVRAGLVQGLMREISAPAEQVFAPTFVQAATFSMHPGTWAQLSLMPLSASEAAGSPGLKLTITDQARASTAWTAATTFTATQRAPSGSTGRIISFVRVQGSVVGLDAPGYQAQALALPDGAWLVKLVPDAALATWGATGLKAALADVTSALATKHASAGEMVVPDMVINAVAGPPLFSDAAKTNLRGLSGQAGIYAQAAGAGALSINAQGMTYAVSQSADFIDRPLSRQSAGGPSRVAVASSTAAPLPDCPASSADVRPMYMAVLHKSGKLSLLARKASFDGPDCNSGSFAAYVQARLAQAVPSAAPLSVAQAAEVATLSRTRAVQDMDRSVSGYSYNSLTVPPLYFALGPVVQAAAHGDTLAALQAALPTVATDAVRAGLLKGLKRQVSARSDWTFAPAFLRVLTFEDQPDTWASLSLLPVPASQLSSDANTRMVITDTSEARWPWAQASPARARWDGGDFGRVDVPMLRVRGPVLRHSAAGYTAAGLPLQGGAWLIKIEPDDAYLGVWGAAGLGAALADVATAIAARPATAATDVADVMLPVMGVGNDSMDNSREMGAAMDEVNSDLRGMDVGGNYLKPPQSSGLLSIGGDALSFNASQSASFVFSPLNRFGPGYGAGSTRVNLVGQEGIRIGPLPPYPTDVLRRFYLAVMQPSGNIVVLTRMASFSGTRCQ